MKVATRSNSAVRCSSASFKSIADSARPASAFHTIVSFSMARLLSRSSRCWWANNAALMVWKISPAPSNGGSASSTMQPSSSKTSRCLSSVFVISGSIVAPPRSRDQAIRLPLKSTSRSPEISTLSLGRLYGTLGSCPAMARNCSCTSFTVRPMAPTTDSCVYPNGRDAGTTPMLLRMPTTLLQAAGFRKEPPKSEPCAIGSIPHANATAAPPLLPPHVLPVSYGFNVAPNTSLKVCEPAPNSGVLVFPTTIAPADL